MSAQQPSDRRSFLANLRVSKLLTETQLSDTLNELPENARGRAIARALVHAPRFIIADEPTGNLDPTLAVEIMGLFAEFQQVGTTVLIASHDLPLIKRMKKRVVVLDHGRLVADIAAQEVL